MTWKSPTESWSYVVQLNCLSTNGRNKVPSRFGLSGRNSDKNGKTHERLRIIGLTRDAIRCSMCRALSALGLSLRCVKDCTKISDGIVDSGSLTLAIGYKCRVWVVYERDVEAGECLYKRACVSATDIASELVGC